MLNPAKILLIFCLFLSKGNSQILYFQDNFKGGVSFDGRCHIAQTYFNADTINFQNSIPSGSTLRRALIIARRFALKQTDTIDTPTRFNYNGISFSFDSSYIATNSFNCDYSLTTHKNQMQVIDVTQYSQSSSNQLILPFASSPPFWYYDTDFYLVLMYDNSFMPSTNIAIILNNLTFSSGPMAYSLMGLNPVLNTNDVALSVLPSNTNSLYNIDVGVTSSLGSYTLGPLYQPSDKINDFTAPGSFYYQNNTLSGLVDDTPDLSMDSTDALANIKTYLPNSVSNFTIDINLHSTWPGCIQSIDGFILAYSSPCPPYQDSPIQTHLICGTGNINLVASSQTSGNSYMWVPGRGLSDSLSGNPVASPSLTTNYVLTITDSLGCHHNELFRVVVDKVPKIDSVKILPYVCGNSLGGATVFTHTNTISPFTYNFGSGFQSTNSISSSGGNYTVILKDGYGCGDTTNFTVPFLNQAQSIFTLLPDSTCLDIPYQFVNNSSGVNTYEWYIDGGLFSSIKNPIYNFSAAQTHTITLIAYQNFTYCSDTTSHILNVLECSINISAPNIFTPNGDGINDTWQLLISETGVNSATFEIDIYDRWGINVFESTDLKRGWDGRTTSGMACIEGTYYYVVKYRTASGSGKTKNGTLRGFIQLQR